MVLHVAVFERRVSHGVFAMRVGKCAVVQGGSGAVHKRAVDLFCYAVLLSHL